MAFELIFGDGALPGSVEVVDLLLSLDSFDDARKLTREIRAQAAGGEAAVKEQALKTAQLVHLAKDARQNGQLDKSLALLIEADSIRGGYNFDSNNEIVEILTELKRYREAIVYCYLTKYYHLPSDYDVKHWFVVHVGDLYSNSRYRPILGTYDEHQVLNFDEQDLATTLERIAAVDNLDQISPQNMFYAVHANNQFDFRGIAQQGSTASTAKRKTKEFVSDVEANPVLRRFLTSSDLAKMTLEQLDFLTIFLRLVRKISQAGRRTNVIFIHAPKFYEEIVGGTIGSSFVSKEMMQRMSRSPPGCFNKLQLEWAIFAFQKQSRDAIVDYFDELQFSLRNQPADSLRIAEMATLFLFSGSKFVFPVKKTADDDYKKEKFHYNSACFFSKLLLVAVSSPDVETPPVGKRLKLDSFDNNWKKSFDLWTLIGAIAFAEGKLGVSALKPDVRLAQVDIKAKKPTLSPDSMLLMFSLQSKLVKKYRPEADLSSFIVTLLARLHYLATNDGNFLDNAKPKMSPYVAQLIDSTQNTSPAILRCLLDQSQKLRLFALETFSTILNLSKPALTEQASVGAVVLHFATVSQEFAQALISFDDSAAMLNLLMDEQIFTGNLMAGADDFRISAKLVCAMKSEFSRRRLAEVTGDGLPLFANRLAAKLMKILQSPPVLLNRTRVNVLLAFHALVGRQPPLCPLRALKNFSTQPRALRLFFLKLAVKITQQIDDDDDDDELTNIYELVGALAAGLLMASLAETDHRCKTIFQTMITKSTRKTVIAALHKKIELLQQLTS